MNKTEFIGSVGTKSWMFSV